MAELSCPSCSASEQALAPSWSWELAKAKKSQIRLVPLHWGSELVYKEKELQLDCLVE
jgi:hypothetical protein